MKFDSKDIALSAVSTALYVTVNVLQMVSVGNPTVYGPVQLHIANSLIALAALFGWPLVAGVFAGCFLTNAYYFIGLQDVILGPIANPIAAGIILLLRKRRFIACVIGALPVGFIVGSYLWLFFPPPEILNVIPVWAGMIVSITIGSLIVIAVIGYLLFLLLSKPNILEPLKSRGLKVIAERK